MEVRKEQDDMSNFWQSIMQQRGESGRERQSSSFSRLALLRGPSLRADIPHVSSGTWVSAGDVGAIPPGAASVGLPDGRVLLAGGEIDGAPSAHVAIYDP